MFHALALAAVVWSAPPAAPSLTPAPAPLAIHIPTGLACPAADMDPSFVRYVPPAVAVKGANPLWLLISSTPPAGLVFHPAPDSRATSCRAMPVWARDGR
jgi:hypothetical protein